MAGGLSAGAVAGVNAAWRETIMSQAIITKAISVARAINVYCSSSSVGMPKLFRTAALRIDAGRIAPSQLGIPRIGAQPINDVNAVAASSHRPATSLLA